MQSKSKAKQDLLSEIDTALHAVSYGSIEIFVQDNKVTQITVRNIKKTSVNLDQESEQSEQPKPLEQKFLTIQARFRRTE